MFYNNIFRFFELVPPSRKLLAFEGSQHERTRGTRPHTCIKTAQGNSAIGQIDVKEAARHIDKNR
jgi:hypothetical protein